MSQMYTQEQLDIALLKNTQEGILRNLQDMKQEIHAMRDEIRTQGHWNVGLILGIYGLIIAAFLGKVFNFL